MWIDMTLFMTSIFGTFDVIYEMHIRYIFIIIVMTINTHSHNVCSL